MQIVLSSMNSISATKQRKITNIYVFKVERTIIIFSRTNAHVLTIHGPNAVLTSDIPAEIVAQKREVKSRQILIHFTWEFLIRKFHEVIFQT